MSRQVSRGSAGEYEADEQAVSHGQLAIIMQMSRQVSRGSAGQYEADEQAGVPPLSWRFSGLCAGRCRGAQLESNKQRSRQVSRG